MRSLLTAILLLKSMSFYAQISTIVKTDSSVIETKQYKTLNSIRVFNEINGTKVIYYNDYYYSTQKLKEHGKFENGNAVGIWKEYAASGKLVIEIDHDKGTILHADLRIYPYMTLQDQFKRKGDSLLIAAYGKDFFAKHVTWDIANSYVYSNDRSDSWTAKINVKPKTALLRYIIHFDGKACRNLIEFEIDVKGTISSNEANEVRGFERLPQGITKLFTLITQKAIALSEQKGLVETDSAKAETYLIWENAASKNSSAGRFLFYVIHRIKSAKNLNPSGRSAITDKYNVYVFNPWTSGFIETKKMKTIRSWESESGNNTGLLPDE